MLKLLFLLILLMPFAISGSPMSIAAIPPKSDQQLQNQASHIVTGTVVSIQTKKVFDRYGYNNEHKATIQVQRVMSAKDKTIAPGRRIQVYYTTLGPGKRPPGPQRQNSPLKKSSQVKLFLMQDSSGKFQLLEPNGWQLI